MTLLRLTLVPVILFALAAGAWAKAETLVLRIKSDDGQIRFFHHGKRLTDATLARLCANARSQKAEIEFQRDKMTGNDALAAILKESDCLGAKPAAGQPKSAAQTHARPRHKAGRPR